MIDLNEMKKQSLEIAKLRGQEVDVLYCLKHCSGEIVEATEAYADEKINNLESETADVIMCMLTMAERVGFDIEKALKDCLEKNRARIQDQEKTIAKAEDKEKRFREQVREIERLKERVKELEKDVYRW